MTSKYYVRKTKDIPRHLELAETDWPALIYKLRGLGYSHAKLHRALDMSREYLYAVMEGRQEPSYSQGVFILALINCIDTDLEK